MAFDERTLESRLVEDIGQARKRVAEKGRAIGIKPRAGIGSEKIGFEPKAVRIKGQTLAQKELAESKVAMNTALDDLLKRSTFNTQAERSQKRLELEDQMGKLRNLVLEKGLEIKRQLGEAKLDFQEKNAILGALTQSAKGLGFAFMTRDTNPQSQLATGTFNQQAMAPDPLSETSAGGFSAEEAQFLA